MATNEDIIRLSSELEKLRNIVKQQEEQRENHDAGDVSHILVLLSKKIDKFKGYPDSNDDLNLREWVADIKNHAESRKLDPGAFAAMIL